MFGSYDKSIEIIKRIIEDYQTPEVITEIAYAKIDALNYAVQKLIEAEQKELDEAPACIKDFVADDVNLGE